VAAILPRVADHRVLVGCSGWNYRDWRGTFYPPGVGPRHWLAFYAARFPTVEVNATFYRLASPPAVAGWVRDTPDDFVFAVKASRYLTHVRRLASPVLEEGLSRFYAAIAPLAASPKLGPVLWQLPANFHRDDDRLANTLAALPPGRHAFEFRHPSWFTDDVLALLRAHGAALVIADHPDRPWQPIVLTADWTYLRFHAGHRGRRGNYSRTELADWTTRIASLREHAEVFAYFNNDWEAFAPRNARELSRLLDLSVATRGGAAR
jgi:uncharacterized protein YecE (DUF72 family)